MDSFRSSPRCRNGAVYDTRVRIIGFPGEVARQVNTPASPGVVSTHRDQVAQVEWGTLDRHGQ
ncbi:hypothetical protein N7517_007049 [Penicillium concentricum]|uniref:Uncharacterized protein n=1 Tax=Penicillium concentricum TaxID=293559 RepID=A0A9W9SF62_9EURO|nr:uncharacterized protein N7517_007049 [Penicillium concentricum]KAJ5375043.1 hypothetical protein N7517_007049 [Penicillium concentricum]